jgi:mannitol-1-phosphate 5-dehydrogenase
MKAVIIGAGRVGCGFLGEALRNSGFEVVVAGGRRDVIEAINGGRYLIDVYYNEVASVSRWVDGVRAISLHDAPALQEALAGARLVFTAVGAGHLTDIIRPLAVGLLNELASFPAAGLDIITCENMPNAVALLRQGMESIATPQERQTMQSAVRFRRAMVWRIVSDRGTLDDILRFRADDVQRMDIESPVGWPPLPQIMGAVARPDMPDAVHEKIHIFNCGHAVAAYLGYLNGFRYIHEALKKSFIRDTVRQALDEAMAWPAIFNGDRHEIIDDCMRRYANEGLADRTIRVAARPVQKLAAFERLVLPAWNALTSGRTPNALSEAIAAALRFNYWEDGEAMRLRWRIEAAGLERTLQEVSGLRQTDELTQMVLARYAAQGPAVQRSSLILPGASLVGRGL